METSKLLLASGDTVLSAAASCADDYLVRVAWHGFSGHSNVTIGVKRGGYGAFEEKWFIINI